MSMVLSEVTDSRGLDFIYLCYDIYANKMSTVSLQSSVDLIALPYKTSDCP